MLAPVGEKNPAKPDDALERRLVRSFDGGVAIRAHQGTIGGSNVPSDQSPRQAVTSSGLRATSGLQLGGENA
jgi:hypothetical protein